MLLIFVLPDIRFIPLAIFHAFALLLGEPLRITRL